MQYVHDLQAFERQTTGLARELQQAEAALDNMEADRTALLKDLSAAKQVRTVSPSVVQSVSQWYRQSVRQSVVQSVSRMDGGRPHCPPQGPLRRQAGANSRSVGGTVNEWYSQSVSGTFSQSVSRSVSPSAVQRCAVRGESGRSRLRNRWTNRPAHASRARYTSLSAGAGAGG
eukprot:1480650-Pyramimonas_sp.AAC.4